MLEVTTKVSSSATGDSFIVDGLVISDSDVVEFLRTLTDDQKCKAVSAAVHFGLLALRDFGDVTKVDWIDKRFQTFENQIAKAFEDAGRKLDDYLGDRGELERAFSDVDGPFRTLLNPNVEGSPLHELRRTLQTDIRDLRDTIVGEEARAEEAAVGTRKGFKFEDEVFEFLQPLCSQMGDTVKKVGTKKVAGRKVGDLVIQVQENRMDGPVKIVLEAKSGSQQVHGKNGLISQLDLAMQGRKAQYGIGVAKPEDGLRGVKGCFAHITPDKMLCTFDPDGRALELAYRFARAEILLRAMGVQIIDSPTCAAVSAKMADVKSKLDLLRNVRSQLTNIQNSSLEIRKTIDSMQADIGGLLAEVEAMISKAKPVLSMKKSKQSK